MTRLRIKINPLFYLFISGLFVSLSFWQAQAQDSRLSIEQCITTALAENPLIHSSLNQYEASLARIKQAKALSQPSLNFDSDLQPGILDIGGAGEYYVGIGKSMLFPGKRKVNASIASEESNEIMMDVELLKLDIKYQVKITFYTLLFNEEYLNYARQNLDLAQNFLDETLDKFAEGDVATVEVLRARVEVAKASSKIKEISNEVELSKANLNFILGRQKNSTIEIQTIIKQTPALPGLEKLKDVALTNRPELKRIKYSIEKESLKERQAGLSYLPDFDLGVNRHTIVGETKTWDLTLAVPIPLFFMQPARGEIAEAKANIQSMQYDLEYANNAVNLEVENAYKNAITANKMIVLFDRDMLVQSEDVYKLLLYSYQEGEISGLELIEARKTLVETQKSYAETRFNYEAAIVSLEKSIGQSIKE